MTNEYLRQAEDFLKKANATLSIKFNRVGINKTWNDGIYRNVYRVGIKTPLGYYGFDFWDSIYNKKRRKKPNIYNVLACLQKYEVGSFEDFCSEFGYEANKYMYENRKEYDRIARIYKAMVEEYEGLSKIFTDEQIEELREIN